MTINIHLEPDEERAILERARLCGRDPAQYVQQIIRDHIQHGPSPGSAGNGVSLEAATTLEDLIDHQFVAACARASRRSPAPWLRTSLPNVRTDSECYDSSSTRVLSSKTITMRSGPRKFR